MILGLATSQGGVRIASLYKLDCSVSVATNRALEYIRQIEQERAKSQKKDF